MASSSDAALARLREHLEGVCGYDPIVVHGIVEAIETAESREEAEDIADIYLSPEGEGAQALDIVKEFLDAREGGAPSSSSSGPTETTDGKVSVSGSAEARGAGQPSRDDGGGGQGQGARAEPRKAAPGEGRPRIRAPQRRICECQATRHDLVANCLACGRIVCEQEGEGPCMFCGVLVTRDADARLEALLHHVRAGPDRNGGGGDGSASVSEALSQKEKLVGYDRAASKQTRVIDDQSDFYEIQDNIWLTPEEKARAEAAERATCASDDAKIYITFDLIGRRILHHDPDEGGEGGKGPPGFESLSLKEGNASGGIPRNPHVDKAPRVKANGARRAG